MHAGAAANDTVAANARTPRAQPVRFGAELAFVVVALALLPSLAAAIRARDWLPIQGERWWKPLVMFGLGNAICALPLCVGALLALRGDSRRQWFALRIASVAIVAPIAWFTWLDFASAESLQWAALGFMYLWPGSIAVALVVFGCEWLTRPRAPSR